MPPTFLYFVAFMIWVPLAILVWVVAGVMLLAPRTRPVAPSLALGMAGTFPGVFLGQLLAAPFVVSILLFLRVFRNTLEPGNAPTTTNPLVIAASIAAIVAAFTIMLGMSVAGFYEGWRIGWMCGKGQRFREVAPNGAFIRAARRLVRGNRPPI